jgi:hypothetical protein
MEAEVLRLSHRLRRTLFGIALGCFAAALLLAAVGFIHVAIWYWLRESFPAKYVAAMFAGADVVLAIILAVFATRSSPGRVELEALVVRRRAMDDAAASVGFSALLLQVVRSFMAARAR